MASDNCFCKDSTIVEGTFGEIPSSFDEPVTYSVLSDNEEEVAPTVIKSYTLSNSNGMQVVLINWGATIVSIKCPDKYGRPADVVLGFDNLESYTNPRLNQYFGCVLGRCANRVNSGRFSIKDKDYQLSLNENFKHHFHGGHRGFGRRVWESCIEDCTVIMTYLSQESEEGYPGAVLATVTFKLTPDNKLEIGMRASTTRSTIVNLSHGSLFNLAGHNAGEEELRKHRVSLNCDRWTFSECKSQSNEAVRGVGGTVMDLRVPRLLSDAMDAVPTGEGFDHNFCVVRRSPSGVSFVARALHAESGRYLEVYSNQPGVQLYTGRHLPPAKQFDDFEEMFTNGASAWNTENRIDFSSSERFAEDAAAGEYEFDSLAAKMDEPLEYIPGKEEARYKKFCAFGIQPQAYPNAINNPHFHCPILRPGQIYCHDIIYKFGVQLASYMPSD